MCFALECYLACVAFRKCFLFLKLISLESVSCYGYFVQCELWVFFVCIFQNGHIGNLSSFFLTLSCCNYVTKCYDVYLYKHAGVLRCQLCLGPQCYGRAAGCGGSYWRPLLTACYGALQVCRSGLDPGYLVLAVAGARRWIYHVLARVVRVPELLHARWPRVRYYAYPTLFLTTPVVQSDCLGYGAWATLLCQLLGLHGPTTL